MHPCPSSPGNPREVLVVGAGLAGLACALDLRAAGVPVRILEAGDAVGGRMRSDMADGFRLDRGFQVCNTSYPQLRRRLDLRALGLRPFTPGALIRTDAGMRRFSDPTRGLRGCADLLPGRMASGCDLAAVARLAVRDMAGPMRVVKGGGDRTTRAELAEAGISEEFVETFFRPFLSGVFLEDGLETSSRFFHLVWRSMLRGTLCLPEEGVGAVPAQLADGLPSGTLRLGAPVARLTEDGVTLADGTEVPGAVVVVATGAADAGRLLPGLPVPPSRTVTTHYHAAPASPLREPTLVIDARRRFLNTCVLSEVAPAYAPDGRALISTSVLGECPTGWEPPLRSALADVYGTDTSDWEHVASYTVRDALPAMPPPQPLTRTCRFTKGRYVCGDHRATGSVQGALASGTRAAREVVADIARGTVDAG
ncbi:NAD(P)/FAD-dependent oxidoreductase [Streptomyces daliensis]|uniref:FAD-dependent oxidoreductase n=1 Tax=Streptomyces daliensis TaxID=299421 RepID=A0A8T4IZH5_9ACTN|nr:FAD-dependent oxidoreductase [Streptomyces daliensis]